MLSTDQYFFKGKKYVGAEGGNPIYEDDVERKKPVDTMAIFFAPSV